MAKVHLGFHAGTAGKATQKTIQGMIRHTLRKSKKTKNHSNEDINKDNTKYNIDYTINKKSTEDLIVDRLENDYKGKRKLRKDQVIIREVITQPSKEYFDGMTMEQKRDEMDRFMRDALPWFMKEFGKKNVVGASAHLDETNPHGHIMVLPMTDDGRVSQTDFFKGPKHLAAQHKSYREHMIARGWDFEKENKYEDVDEVDLPTYKANATKIEKGRKEQTEAIRGLMSDDEIRQEATEAVLNDILREEREKMDKEQEAIEKMKLGYFRAIVSHSTSPFDLEYLDKVEKEGIDSITDGQYHSVLRYSIMDVVKHGNSEKMLKDVQKVEDELKEQEKEERQEQEIIKINHNIDLDDGPEL